MAAQTFTQSNMYKQRQWTPEEQQQWIAAMKEQQIKHKTKPREIKDKANE
jgi:hypothetical protein